MIRSALNTATRPELDLWLGCSALGTCSIAGISWAMDPASDVVPATLVGGAALALMFVVFAGMLRSQTVKVVRATPRVQLVGMALLDATFVALVVRAVLAHQPDVVRVGASLVLFGLFATGCRHIMRATTGLHGAPADR